jgi:transposase InsO family protein
MEGWLYLAVILDLFSRRVVGWATSRNVDRHLALAALDMALTHRRPTTGLIHHSDRGSTYASFGLIADANSQAPGDDVGHLGFSLATEAR